jgi:hypothetical protein
MLRMAPVRTFLFARRLRNRLGRTHMVRTRIVRLQRGSIDEDEGDDVRLVMGGVKTT